MAPSTKLTAAAHAEIAEKLVSGCTLEVAATAVGVKRRTLQTWLAVGRQAAELASEGRRLTERQRKCLDLLEAEQTARAELKVRLLVSIQNAAKTDHRAAEWLLERIFPAEFAPRSRGKTERPGTGRPVGSSSAPDRTARPQARPGVLRAVK